MDTQAKLLQAAADTVREQSIASASARVIAGRAGVNQALIFYHFGTVASLIDVACRQAVDVAVEQYREDLAQVTSLAGLLAVGRQLHARELASGNVAMMAQLMAGARADPVLGGTARYSMEQWAGQIEVVVRRVLAGSPVESFADSAGLARAVSAAFIGLELYDGVDPEGAAHALDSLEQLGVLVEVVNDLGPVARRALHLKLKGARSAAARRRP